MTNRTKQHIESGASRRSSSVVVRRTAVSKRLSDHGREHVILDAPPRVGDKTGHGETPGLFPESADELPEAVKELALRLERRGGRALIGDLTIFDEARRLRSEHTARYTREPTELDAL